MEILSTLGIDWTLLLAQMVNFGIVLFVLQRFVYKPLLATIDKRRALAQQTVDGAAHMQRELDNLEVLRDAKLRQADADAGAIIQRAKTEAETLRTGIVDAARRQAADIVERGKQQVEQERAQVFRDVQGKVAETIVRATEKIVRRSFTAEDQERLLADLNQELPSLLS